MIIDKFENAGNYVGVVKHLAEALQFIDGNYNLPLGRHPFEGGAVIATEGVSLPLSQKEFEAHRDFADVMMILEHDETVSYRSIEDLTPSKPYDKDGDCAMYTGTDKDIVVTVPRGHFYVMMPGEGHKPAIHLDGEKPFKKYIVKCSQL